MVTLTKGYCNYHFSSYSIHKCCCLWSTLCSYYAQKVARWSSVIVSHLFVVRHAKWFDLLQIKTSVLLDGPSFTRLHFGGWKVKVNVKHMKMPKLFLVDFPPCVVRRFTSSTGHNVTVPRTVLLLCLTLCVWSADLPRVQVTVLQFQGQFCLPFLTLQIFMYFCLFTGMMF